MIDFQNPNTVQLAEAMVGQSLCTRDGANKVKRLMITETEAYDGPEDGACHAHLRRRTKRTEVMFQRGGCYYVYLCYGIHWLLNIVTGPVDYPAAVLIRGAGPYDGPGKLTRGLEIDGRFNGKPLDPTEGLWIESNKNFDANTAVIQRTPRIGIDYAGPYWSQVEYRFVLSQQGCAKR